MKQSKLKNTLYCIDSLVITRIFQHVIEFDTYSAATTLMACRLVCKKWHRVMYNQGILQTFLTETSYLGNSIQYTNPLAGQISRRLGLYISPRDFFLYVIRTLEVEKTLLYDDYILHVFILVLNIEAAYAKYTISKYEDMRFKLNKVYSFDLYIDVQLWGNKRITIAEGFDRHVVTDKQLKEARQWFWKNL